MNHARAPRAFYCGEAARALGYLVMHPGNVRRSLTRDHAARCRVLGRARRRTMDTPCVLASLGARDPVLATREAGNVAGHITRCPGRLVPWFSRSSLEKVYALADVQAAAVKPEQCVDLLTEVDSASRALVACDAGRAIQTFLNNRNALAVGGQPEFGVLGAELGRIRRCDA